MLLLLAYTHAILGYAWFGRHHQEGKCDNLFGCSMTYIVSGIKGNSIEDAMEDLTTPAALWVDLGAWARIGLDMSFHIIIPVILLSIISGIIIDGFGELRDEESQAKEYRENTCVVCGVDRARMDAARPGSFDRHVAAEQNPHHYVFLLHKLEAQSPEDDSNQERHVRHALRQPDAAAAFLPQTAIVLQARHDDSAAQDGKVMVELLRNIESRLGSLEKEVRWQTRDALAKLKDKDDDEDLAGPGFWGGLNPLNMKMPDMPTLPTIEMPTLPVELPKMPELKAPEVPECRQQ